jgi:hypothetical protein
VKGVELCYTAIGLKQDINFSQFELKSFRLNVKNKTLNEVDLMEQ